MGTKLLASSVFFSIFLLFASCLVVRPLKAQMDDAGELLIRLYEDSGQPSEDSLWIYVDAQGVVWGASSQGYPITHDYDSLSDYDNAFTIDHVEDINVGEDSIAFGKYKITISGNSIYVDYRDCDYPGSYSDSDIWIYYKVGTGKFYKNASLTQRIDTGSTVSIWEDGRKGPGEPDPTQTCFLIDITVQNNFSGGQIEVDDNTCTSPYSNEWSLMSTHEVAAISPQNVGGGNYIWCAWSDDGAQSHNVSVGNDPPPSLTITAEFVGTYITGPGYLSKGQTGTYDCNPTCASGNCSYQWYKRYDGSEYWYTLGTNQTQQITMYSTPFTVKVEVSDDDHDKTAIDTKYVTNELDGGESGAGGGMDNVVVLHNYPNPFNPETTIRYQLPKPAHVTLRVHNLLGEKVATLYNGHQEPGFHAATWDGRRFDGFEVASGIYLYRLSVRIDGGEDFVDTKKMSLLH